MLINHKAEHVLQVALLFHDQRPDWRAFFNEIFGIDGAIAKAFPDRADAKEFRRTPEYARCQGLLADLRRRPVIEAGEEMTVITVRLPKSVHASLKAESRETRTSLNKLCLQRLMPSLQVDMAGGGEVTE